MNKFKVGDKVKLSIDKESIYTIVEINPSRPKGITIRKDGDGILGDVASDEIVAIN